MSSKKYQQLGDSGGDNEQTNNNEDNSNNNDDIDDYNEDNRILNSNNNNNSNNTTKPMNILKSVRSPELYYVPAKKISLSGDISAPSMSSSPNSGPVPTTTSPTLNSLGNSKNNSPIFTTSSPVIKSLTSLPPLNLNDSNLYVSNTNNIRDSNNSIEPITPMTSSQPTTPNSNQIELKIIKNNQHLRNNLLSTNSDENIGSNGDGDSGTNTHNDVDGDDDDRINFLNTIKQITTFKFEKKHKKKLTNYLLALLPVVDWLPKYNLKEDWKGDLIAGITVGVMLVPQGLAYALVAGLPPIYGLYSSIIPVLAYCIFGTSRQLSMGPFAIISLLVSETVNGVVGAHNKDDVYRVSVAILLAFVCGAIQMFLGLIRFGFVANFLSDPVKSGFISGSALVIGSSQLKHMFGFTVENSNFLLLLVIRYLKRFTDIKGWTFLLGMIGIAILIGIKKANARWKLKIPGPLLVVVLFTIISYFLGLKDHMAVVGDIPSGFPSPSFPLISYNSTMYGNGTTVDGDGVIHGLPLPPNTNWLSIVIELIPGSLVLILVGFISSVSIGAKFGEKYNYTIDPNQELFALGASDFFGSFFLSFPVGASLSRTAVNAQSGAVTQISSFISTVIIVLSVFFLAPIVYFLPRAILSSIVIVAIIDLVEYQMVFELWKVHRKDLLLFCVSFFSTTVLGILQGILIGTITSLLMIIYRSAYPPFAVLGRLPGTEIYKNIKRVPKAETFKGIRIVRIDGSIYFANCMFIKKKLRHHEPFHRFVAGSNGDEESIQFMTDSEAENANIDDDVPIEVVIDGHTTIGAIIIDFSSVNDIDSTGIRMLKELVTDFRKRQMVIYFASVKGYVRDSMKRGGVVNHYGADHFFWTINDAVEHHLFLLRQSKRSKELLNKSSNRNSNNSSILTSSPLSYNQNDGIPLLNLKSNNYNT